CLSGRVVDSSAGPVYGALVRACGLDYCGLTFARTASDGTYCLPVKRNSTVRLEAVPPGGLLVADSLDVSVPDTAASCGSGNCMQVNDLVVAFDSCVSGHVTEPDGTPIDGAEVFTSGGGHAVTGADGAFCMRVPGNVWLAVYVVGRPPKAVLTPAAATCEAGNCAEVELCVDYPEDGDVVGFIFSNLDTVEHLVLPDEKNHTSTAMFFSGYEGEQFDLYETGSVIDSCEVFTPVLSLDFSLALYIGAAWNSQLAFQLLFDLDFALNAPFLNDLVPDGEVFGALDPGSPATLTDGTDTIDMLRPLDYYYELFGDGYWDTLGYAYLEPWMGGWFVQSPAVSSAFDNGDVLTYTWPGGVDIGAFSVTGQIPGRLNFTAPATLNGILDAEPLADLTLQWDATTPGDLVTIVLETVVLDTAKSSLEFGVVVCRVADDGEYTIPAATLAQLPAADGLFAVRTNFLLAVRHEIVKQPVPLPRAGGTGYVVLFSSPEPTMACSFDASFGL
ncbi:MAG: carboxypeptidase regulatory-like domain-containing protein, partial [Candidatus Hydrogenedentes bacterium]|nr:carboxypeptidase regulatory-like domain-containing protein [Candidatus Hydrogenedentota bacterium]